MQRRLATIMAADVVGYSARMGDAEAETIARLATLRELADRHVTRHQGRIFSRAGDGFLVEFQSPVSAVRAAYELQRELSSEDTESAVGLELRIGVHLADVVVDGEDLLGDGVNIASRIESVAEPNRVYLSQSVFEQVKRSAMLTFESKGETQLKNISEPVALYAVVGELGAHSCGTAVNASALLSTAKTTQSKPHSLVVVPYQNMSGDPDQEYFADGFTEDLITELSRFSGIFLISRNASFALKGIAEDAKSIGGKLGARYCLEGTVRKMGERIRITSYLTDASTGEQLWTEKSDCAYAELFDLQDELITKIAALVGGRIERQAAASATRKRPDDMLAYDCLMRGLELHRVGGITRENAEQALLWLDEAIKRDPKFGRAYAWRACALATLAEWDGRDVWDECWSDGRLAVELAEDDAESHRIVGSLSLYSRDYDRAIFHFQRALELNPNHAFIIGRMGELYNFLGQPQKALEYQNRAKELDPFLPEYCRELEAVSYYLLGEYRECYRVVGELTRLTRRAAAYQAAAAHRLGDGELIDAASRSLYVVDHNFDPTTFVGTEYYKDRAIREGLKSDLKAISQRYHELLSTTVGRAAEAKEMPQETGSI
jgi:TolB-like protein/tetratricopeptide (TPR) repeat protein